MRPARFVILSGALLVALAAFGCGTPCQQIRDDRSVFLAREAGADAPHLEIVLPFAAANRLLQRQAESLPDLRVPLSAGGTLGRYLAPLRVVPRTLELRPAPAGTLGLHLLLDLYYGKNAVVDLHLDLHLRPRLDAGKRRVVLAIRADDLRAVRPRLAPDAARRLARHVRGQLPAVARRLIPAGAIESVARSALEQVVERSHRALRDGPLRHVGEIARLSFALPALPIRDVRISSSGTDGGHLRLGLVTTLPVDAALSGRAPSPSPRHATVRLTGQAAAELANWAIAEGRAPGRFDQQGHMDPDGPFDVGLGWRSGSHPFKVLLWKTTGDPCLRGRMGGRPEFRIEHHQLRAGATDVRIEQIRGPALYEFAALFAPVFGPSFDFVLHESANFEARVGGQELRFDVQKASLDGDELRIELDVTEWRPL